MKPLEAGRLPEAIRPVLYEISIKVIPEEKSFSGMVNIDVQSDQAVEEITLHTLDLKIHEAIIQQGRSKPLLTPFKIDLPSETLTLSCPQPISPGTAQVSISFSGKLNRQMRGLYEAHAGGETYAFSQFEATDARRMFPCFDEPAMKARFCLSVTFPSTLTALSNMPVIHEENIDGMKRCTFDETPVMSTYLLALAVAKMEQKEIEIAGTRVSIWTPPGQLALGDFALKVTGAALPLLNDYFALPYPYPKLDLVCVPDFAMGAMENWGAIFFRDSRLLLDEQLASSATQRSVANVIIHEIVHQWFGNLVTMLWWDDLWLNESFATWLACKIVDLWRPEWHSWIEFQHEKEIPLALDALETTRPIRSEVTDPAQIEEMFDVLTYEKGAACLRMIEQFLGEQPFREGIRAYIKDHQYQNATAAALWSALESASGQSVSTIAADWFNRAGFPLIRIQALDALRRDLTITQRRFRASDQDKNETEDTWSVPFRIKYEDASGVHLHRLLLQEARTPLHIPGEGRVYWIYGNAEESGFLRTDYDPALRASLQEVATTALLPEERIGTLNHLWALSSSGEVPISTFMETLCRMKGDLTRVVVEEMVGCLEILLNQLVLPEDRAIFTSLAKTLLSPAWETFGWDPAIGEDDDRRLARAAALWAMGAIVQDEEILSELPRRQTRYLAKPASLDPTLATPLIRLCARTDGGTRFDQYLSKFKTSTSPEERDRYLIALADFQRPALTRKVLDFLLSDDVRAQDVWRPIRLLLANQSTQETTWNFIKTHWKSLCSKGGSVGAQRMIQATRSLWRESWLQEVNTFFNTPKNKIPSAERALRQTLEFIQLGIRFKDQQESCLSAWLKDYKE